MSCEKKTAGKPVRISCHLISVHTISVKYSSGNSLIFSHSYEYHKRNLTVFRSISNEEANETKKSS